MTGACPPWPHRDQYPTPQPPNHPHFVSKHNVDLCKYIKHAPILLPYRKLPLISPASAVAGQHLRILVLQLKDELKCNKMW